MSENGAKINKRANRDGGAAVNESVPVLSLTISDLSGMEDEESHEICPRQDSQEIFDEHSQEMFNMNQQQLMMLNDEKPILVETSSNEKMVQKSKINHAQEIHANFKEDAQIIDDYDYDEDEDDFEEIELDEQDDIEETKFD